MGAYNGPYIVFDFDKSGAMVGIEIVGDDPDDESEEGNEATPELVAGQVSEK